MAVRYVEIGQYPDVRREVRGNLSEILAATANPGTYAAPEDVTGTFLEMGADGLWTGASVGTLTQGQADALVASGALASVEVGTPGNVAGTLVRYGGAGVGWVAVNSAPALLPSAVLNATGLRMAIFGSSSSAYCGSPKGDATFTGMLNWDTPTATSEFANGYLWHAISANGCTPSIALNYGLESQEADDILQMVTDAVTSRSAEFDIAIFQNMSNDLATYGFSSFGVRVAFAESALNLLLKAGKRVVIVVPNTRPLVNADKLQSYFAYSAWAANKAALNPASVVVVDLFRDVFNSQPTSQSDITGGDTTHLNIPALRRCASAWRNAVSFLGISFGEFNEFTLPRYVDSLGVSGGSLNAVNCTKTQIEADAFGRPQFLLEATADSAAYNKVITLPAVGGSYRIAYDYDIVTPVNNLGRTDRHPGIWFRCNSIVHKIGIDCSTSEDWLGPVAGRYRGISHRIKTNGTTAATLAIWPGFTGSVLCVRSVSIHACD